MTTELQTEARRATASVFDLTECSRLELVAGRTTGSLPRSSLAETLAFTPLLLATAASGETDGLPERAGK